ncbi:phytyl ester synthase 2, chloroplastic-like isoform X1 [Silene latifolia]|uniref:phytyl ester synthase 2, chloroplastic-like isoform X1 n=1 Tax=Silene latifolia TaxID=37657 RepID=UPI003D770685
MRSISAPFGCKLPWLSHVDRTIRQLIGPGHVSYGLGLQTRPLSMRCDRVRPRLGMKGYFEQDEVLMKSVDNGGPRWFTPLECGGSRLENSPLLLYLPGIDGVGLGLMKHHVELGKIFEVWCLHIPITDRTPFSELVKLVEDRIRSEFEKSANRPIYLIGEGVGGCFALSIAANNPHLDLVLILANPTTYLSKFNIHLLKPFLSWMRSQMSLKGEHMEVFRNIMEIMKVTGSLSSIDTAVWKLEMLIDSSTDTSSRLHQIKAQTLILSSGKNVFPSTKEEGERLSRVLPNCHKRSFNDRDRLLFLDDDFDLVFTIKRTGFYRRRKSYDCLAEYSIVTHQDIHKTMDSVYTRTVEQVIPPAMYSTLKSGEIVSGLGGYPNEGPTLIVGYHMLTGLEAIYLVMTIFKQKNILVRGLGHPNLFKKSRYGGHIDLSWLFDHYRIMGCVPVSGRNMYELLRSNSHVLLYPGGMREAFHRKGEEYKLFWPEETEFVRMAAATGAKIVPFGVVGEDDIYQLCADYSDFAKIPFVKQSIEVETISGVKLRGENSGEVSNQPIHFPLILPKVPGRLYFIFGKPIETKGRQEELKDKQKAGELYLQIKGEVEASLAYLKEKRKHDPYRNLFPRLLYQSIHGFNTQVPGFDP